MVKKKTPYSDTYRRRYYSNKENKNHKLEENQKKLNRVLPKENIEKRKENNNKKPKTMPQTKNQKDILHEVEEVLSTKKAIKFERYVIALIYILIILGAGYFFLVNVNPDTIPNDFYNYKISASDYMINSKIRSLYLKDSDIMGEKTTFNNESVRLIVSEKPFSFIFNPKRKIAENTSAKIQLSFVNPKTEVYLDDKLIIPDLNGFKKVADFKNRGIWVKSDLTKSYYIREDSPKDFIYANYPGMNFYSFGNIKGGLPVIADYKKKTTKIHTRFRGNLKLAVYTEGNLSLKFTKQDLNWYIGKDEYTVKITDINGNVYFNKTYGDDGDDKKGSGNFEQKITIDGKKLPRNIYYITFKIDKNNKAADSTIKDIIINSNKVLIVGKVLPITGFNFYTQIKSPQKIRFLYWHTGKDQKIYIRGTENKIIDLNKSFKGVKYSENLGAGGYTFQLAKGDLWVYSNLVSLTKENWFYLPQKGDGELINQNIIVIDKDKLKINGSDVVWSGIIPVKEGTKIRLQVLDKLKIYFKEIKLVL